jgi:RNA polymerase sigma factor (sigma-70 family)
MRASYKSVAFRELDHLLRCGTAPTADGALVGRFVSERSESAFEALVARHGPMVLGVCRRLLNSAQDADDAFQATFLVLAQKAARLRDPDRVGPWLYGVATRVANKARVRAGRHRHEPLGEAFARDDSSTEWSDVLPIVDAELGSLPAKHRDVLVLCLLQGATPEEASSRLGCPVGTVKSRLARGRESLRARLIGRGIAPALVGLLTTEAIASAVPATLVRATLDTIAGSAVAPDVVALIKGAVPIMLAKSTVAAALIVGALALAGAGTAARMRTSEAQETAPNFRPTASQNESISNNLKQVLLAFHNYLSVNGRMPASATYGADGEPKLSWRVALLPFLEEADLYSQFHQDEPWDSPHNKALIARMPAVFQTPGTPPPQGETRIRGFAGKGAMFEGTQGVPIQDITDGTSNTVLVTVAGDSTPWTRPGELPFVAGQPLPTLDDSDPEGIWLGFADGSARRVPKQTLNKMLRSLITRNGGEVIMWPDNPGRPAAVASAPPGLLPTPRLGPTPAPAPSTLTAATGPTSQQSIEDRLAQLERKLELVMRKLEDVLRDRNS